MSTHSKIDPQAITDVLTRRLRQDFTDHDMGEPAAPVARRPAPRTFTSKDFA